MGYTSAGIGPEHSPETLHSSFGEGPSLQRDLFKPNEDKRPVDLGLLQSPPGWTALQATQLRHQAQSVADALAAVGVPAAVLVPTGHSLIDEVG